MLPETRDSSAKPVAVIGRYALYGVIGRGGLASVHLGRMFGMGSFSRTVAIKRLHAHFATDPDVSASLLDEARLTARIRHPNVVQTIDVVALEGELLLVMDYVEGESLAKLLAGGKVPIRIAAAILIAVLEGLDAAHHAKSEDGQPLGIVHRDVSPQNVMVGVDGIARLIDFGVAKAAGRARSTESGRAKGKLGYMAPEQVRGRPVSAKTDVFAASVVLWEALTGKRLFARANEGETLFAVLEAPVQPPSQAADGIGGDLDPVVLKGLEREPGDRWASAAEMAAAIESAVQPAPAREVAAWVKQTCAAALEERTKLVESIESDAGKAEPREVSTPEPQLGTERLHPTKPNALKRLGFALFALLAIAALASLAFLGMRSRQSAVATSPAPEPTGENVAQATSAPAVSAASTGVELAPAPVDPPKSRPVPNSTRAPSHAEPSTSGAPPAASADRWRLRTRN